MNKRSPDCLHERLSISTAGAHASVERLLNLRMLTQSLAKYTQALVALEASLTAALCALNVTRWDAWRPDLARIAARRNWLRDDLGYLNAAPADLGASIDLSSTGFGLGCLYVLEGSALGGLVILKAANRAFGISALAGGRYFHGLGEETLSTWRMFVSNLNTVPAASAIGDEAEIGALRTFGLFEASLLKAGF